MSKEEAKGRTLPPLSASTNRTPASVWSVAYSKVEIDSRKYESNPHSSPWDPGKAIMRKTEDGRKKRGRKDWKEGMEKGGRRESRRPQGVVETNTQKREKR
ncbi:hypothetical protein B0H10DRAFT_1947486 [Mycena sp. CBHHK59/15]|nr:hypothetical protein B0H10DRAFT_1947486 [Mycena sp. CBHHK59/15]